MRSVILSVMLSRCCPLAKVAISRNQALHSLPEKLVGFFNRSEALRVGFGSISFVFPRWLYPVAVGSFHPFSTPLSSLYAML